MGSVKKSDKGAAMAGLVVGGCLIYLFVFGMVQFTNKVFEAKHHAATEAAK